MRSSQIFSVCGLPDVAVQARAEATRRTRAVRGRAARPRHLRPVDDGDAAPRGDDVPAWFLDTDYNGLVFHVSQAFFPRTSAWDSLKRALKAEFEESRLGPPRRHTSARRSNAGEHAQIAVKVIDDRGNELLVVHALG